MCYEKNLKIRELEVMREEGAAVDTRVRGGLFFFKFLLFLGCATHTPSSES